MSDVDPVVAAALITAHATIHASSHSVAPVAKAEKVKCPLGQRRTGSTSSLDGAIM